MLHHAATCCNMLQHTVVCCYKWDISQVDTLQHTATHCNTLQHAATRCTTLQQMGHIPGYKGHIPLIRPNNTLVIISPLLLAIIFLFTPCNLFFLFTAIKSSIFLQPFFFFTAGNDPSFLLHESFHPRHYTQ